MLTVKKYQAGSNFTKYIDSSKASARNGFNYDFTSDGEYVITVYPVGRIHKLKSIGSGNERERTGDGYQSDECSVSISYIIDDSLIQIPEQFGQNTSATATVYITD